jgi:hypothetical protein
VVTPNPLNRYAKYQQVIDGRLKMILIEAAVETARKIYALATKPGVGARTREAQLAMFLQYLKEEQEDLWSNHIQPLIQRSFPGAADAANSAADYIDNLLRHAVGERQADALLEGIKVQARIAQQFDLEARAKNLSGKVWKNVNVNSGRIARTVQKHLVTGSVNARELANDVKAMIDPATPGGVSYAAMRLARTEINAAFHDRQKTIAEERPWVKAARWNLSKSHKGRDVCDLIAAGHSQRQSRGLYLPGDVPDKPHPHCLCYLTYDLISDRDMTNLLRAELGKAPLAS